MKNRKLRRCLAKFEGYDQPPTPGRFNNRLKQYGDYSQQPVTQTPKKEGIFGRVRRNVRQRLGKVVNTIKNTPGNIGTGLRNAANEASKNFAGHLQAGLVDRVFDKAEKLAPQILTGLGTVGAGAFLGRVMPRQEHWLQRALYQPQGIGQNLMGSAPKLRTSVKLGAGALGAGALLGGAAMLSRRKNENRNRY